jgi:hypothetical protein
LLLNLSQERQNYEFALDALQVVINIGKETKNQGDVARADNHFKRIANKIREEDARVALLEERGVTLAR